MNKKDTNMDDRIRELLAHSGVEKTGTDFTRNVMKRVEQEKRLRPYKRDNTLMHMLMALGLPLLYLVYQYVTGSETFISGIDLSLELQPYLQLFHLVTDKLVNDISSPVVPLGILAIVVLLVFDRLILRSLSFK